MRRAASPISSSDRSTLLLFPISERYCSSVTPRANSRTSRTKRSISRRYASSRDIKRPLVLEYVAPSDVVRAALDGNLLDEIHLSSDDRFELVLHPDQIEQRPSRRVFECHQNIDIAVFTELVGAQHRPEKTQLDHPPLAAVGLDRLTVEIECDRSLDAHANSLTASSSLPR